MLRCSRTIGFAVLSIICCGVAARADTLRCQSVNGNLNCSGSGGVSCQTVDGKKVCTSGHGDVVQTFGNGAAPDAGDDDPDGAPPGPPPDERVETRDAQGRTLLIRRDGMKLHFRSDRLSVDRQ